MHFNRVSLFSHIVEFKTHNLLVFKRHEVYLSSRESSRGGNQYHNNLSILGTGASEEKRCILTQPPVKTSLETGRNICSAAQQNLVFLRRLWISERGKSSGEEDKEDLQSPYSGGKRGIH